MALLDSREQQLQLSSQAQQIENQARLGRFKLLTKQHTGMLALAEKDYVSEIQLDEIAQRVIDSRSAIDSSRQKIAAAESELKQIPIQRKMLTSELGKPTAKNALEVSAGGGAK